MSDANADTKGKVLYGKLTYDRVPSTLEDGLDYRAVVQKPIRNVRVVLVEYSKEGGTNRELAATVSGEDGSYSLPVPDLVTRVRVRAFAETANPPLRVQDNTNGNALYTLESAAITTTAALTVKDLNAGSGWGGSSYTGARAAAPFASLDTLYGTARAFMAVRPQVNFPLLPINWSVNNRPEPGDSALGQIDTSHYNSRSGGIYILGKADVDTDEYDAHVMVHEWGHYFEDKLGRSDSIGGSHGSGDIVDPRLAFGEGWGNALSAMILFPDANYKDTGGVGQARTTLVIDMETNDADDPTPGWFSEASVQSVLYDLFDPANESFDKVALGLGPIYDIMTGGQKSTSAVTSIFSFTNALKAVPGTSASTLAAIDSLTSTSRIDPIQDAFGTGETNNGSNAANLPVFRQMTVDGASQTLTFLADVDNVNRLGANRYIRFSSPAAGPIQVVANSSSDIGLALLEDGKKIAVADNDYSGTEQLSFLAKANKVYILTVQGFVTKSSGQYTASLRIASGDIAGKAAIVNRKTKAVR
ncbi:hypothetical protein HF313_12575 [Massilia atriviolacea]|uniref:Uncharacterized protein n=1 Tax=Massilia atriviolacea TaxID=2495579 RepID=A0A430HGH9_9BURK|nr:hypothetical protein [Massilia atriviolacea]RSZ56629.1 hypothetical protein EJB06_23655 [Massilia atriviolacea]